MSTKFQVGRRYKASSDSGGVFVVRALSACGTFLGIQWEGTGCFGSWPQLAFANAIELPPPEGEFYLGEEVEVNTKTVWMAGTYISPLAGCHVVDVCSLGLRAVTANLVRRPVPKPATIWRAPTDQDAIDVPRRPCRVRDYPAGEAREATLVAVDAAASEEGRAIYHVRCAGHNAVSVFCCCEIEVPNE